MTRSRTKASRIILACGLIAVSLGAAACSSPLIVRKDTAERLATPSFMHKREIPAGPFRLTAYERVRKQGQAANIYIEGDGQAFFSYGVPAIDPTPINPVALHISTRDLAPNVIYLARPCQYSGMIDKDIACNKHYWSDARYGKTTVGAMNSALDDIKKRYAITGFNLVGYAGGGAMAALVAAERKDILSLRTIAAPLDTTIPTLGHKVPNLSLSMNPVTVAAQIADIPQNHFLGEWDRFVGVTPFDSFRCASGETTCIRSTIIGKADNEAGWVNKWPALLDLPVDCEKKPPVRPVRVCPVPVGVQ